MSERNEDPELTALASALRKLRPQSETLDQAVLMYRAGRASARRWVWPALTMLSVGVALALGIAGWFRPAPTVVERTVYVAAPVPAAPQRKNANVDSPETPSLPEDATRGAWSSYVRLQEKVLEDGLDGLPQPSNPPQQPPSLESLLRSF
jgi:hypothetical protein